jgi:hypothetical protein
VGHLKFSKIPPYNFLKLLALDALGPGFLVATSPLGVSRNIAKSVLAELTSPGRRTLDARISAPETDSLASIAGRERRTVVPNQ